MEGAEGRVSTGAAPSAPPPLLDGRGRVALVTGAAGGIGRAVSALLAATGTRVAGLDVAMPADVALALQGSAADGAFVRSAVNRVVTELGRLDWVVHAAGFAQARAYDALDESEWHAVMDANLTSAFLVTQAAHPALAAARGAVVLFSSTNGRNGGSALSGAAYAVAKAGIVNLTRHLAKAWAAEGIRANCIAPGPVTTPMLDRFTDAERDALRRSVPLQRLIDPAEIAGTVGFLLSHHAASMTGTCLNVSGGLVLD